MSDYVNPTDRLAARTNKRVRRDTCHMTDNALDLCSTWIGHRNRSSFVVRCQQPERESLMLDITEDQSALGQGRREGDVVSSHSQRPWMVLTDQAGADANAAALIALKLARRQRVASLEDLASGVGVSLGKVHGQSWVGCIRA